MMKYLVVLLFILGSLDGHGQLTTSQVESWVKSCEPESGLDSLEWLYIINGVIYIKPEEELKSFDTKNQLLFIDYINTDSVESTFLKPNMLLILIGSSPKLKKEERAEKLQEQQMKFRDNSDTVLILHRNPNDPVLIINEKLISPEKAKQTISILNPKDVRYIQYVNHTSYALYGIRAKNGMVKILTKGYTH
ncbi:MAG: hypothetical protein OEW75_16920 [Cyclobacteriaceae bacterium]|nr:hypothetical protein [Cyclobacteriaceae bacterium]